MRRLASRRSQALCGRCQRLCDPRRNVHRVALQTLAISSDFTGAKAYVSRAPRTELHRRPAASSRSHRYSPLPSTASRHRRRVVLLACQRRVTRRARRLALAAFQLGSSSGFWSKKVRAQSVKAVENGEPVLPRRTLFWILARSAEGPRHAPFPTRFKPEPAGLRPD